MTSSRSVIDFLATPLVIATMAAAIGTAVLDLSSLLAQTGFLPIPAIWAWLALCAGLGAIFGVFMAEKDPSGRTQNVLPQLWRDTFATPLSSALAIAGAVYVVIAVLWRIPALFMGM